MKESFQLTSSDLHNLSDIFTITLVDKSEPDFSSKTFKLAKKDIDNFYKRNTYIDKYVKINKNHLGAFMALSKFSLIALSRSWKRFKKIYHIG